MVPASLHLALAHVLEGGEGGPVCVSGRRARGWASVLSAIALQNTRQRLLQQRRSQARARPVRGDDAALAAFCGGASRTS